MQQATKQPAVLLVHDYYQVPGGEDVVVANEKHLLETHGHAATLYARRNEEISRMGALEKIRSALGMFFSIRTYREVRRSIRENRISLVHVHNTLPLIGPAVYYAAFREGVPVVQTVHNFRLLCPNALFYRDGHICEDCTKKGLHCAVKHRCYRGSRLQTVLCVLSTRLHRALKTYSRLHYITLTDFNRQKLLALEQIPPENVSVKPNFVEPSETIVPYAARENQVVYIGRLDALKGIRLLLEAWARYERSGGGMKLIICGTGPEEAWCREYLTREKLKQVELRGFVPNSAARALMGQSKALILPTHWYEGFPMTIVEAFSAATPVICSDLGNAGSLISDGVTGFKFPADSAEQLAQTLNRLQHAESVSEGALKTYQENFTAEANYRQLMAIYSKAMQKSGERNEPSCG